MNELGEPSKPYDQKGRNNPPPHPNAYVVHATFFLQIFFYRLKWSKMDEKN